jgi:FkbM family methyltransferase
MMQYLSRDAVERLSEATRLDPEAVRPPKERGIELRGRPVVLLGLNGRLCEDFYDRVLPQLKLVAMIDNRAAGQDWRGLVIGNDQTLSELFGRETDLVGINIGSSPHFYQVSDTLGLPCLSLMQAYQALALPQPMRMFEDQAAIIREHQTEILDFGERLADEESRQTLYRLMLYRLSLDLRHLQAVARPWDDQFYGNGFVDLRPDEVLIEGGAYDGDSIRHFLARSGGRYREIVAFEPDVENFVRLREFTASLPNVRAICKGLSDVNGTERFATGEGMASHFDADGAGQVEVCRLDDEVDAPVTFLKLDIEGAEMAALAGARQTIARYSPKIAVAIYHRPDDILTIPAVLEGLDRRQRLYLRHHSGFHYDTTLFAIPDGMTSIAT